MVIICWNVLLWHLCDVLKYLLLYELSFNLQLPFCILRIRSMYFYVHTFLRLYGWSHFKQGQKCNMMLIFSNAFGRLYLPLKLSFIISVLMLITSQVLKTLRCNSTFTLGDESQCCLVGENFRLTAVQPIPVINNICSWPWNHCFCCKWWFKCTWNENICFISEISCIDISYFWGFNFASWTFHKSKTNGPGQKS